MAMDIWPDPAACRGAWAFGGFTLDLDRAELTDAAGSVVPLRPKILALLECLLAEAGRVVERAALLDAVWPGVTVTDESLSQAVAELRQALGEEGRLLVRTVPRRGYRLDAQPRRQGRAPQAGAPLLGPPSDEFTATVAACGHAAVGPRRWPGPGRCRRPGVRLRRRHALAARRRGDDRGERGDAATAGATAGSGLSALGDPAIPGPPSPAGVAASQPAPRDEATRLSLEGARWSHREGGPAAWLGQRDLFQRAIAIDPTYAPAWSNVVFTYTNMISLGRSLNPTEDLRAAEQAAERAIALAPGRSDAHAALGSVLRLQPDRLEEALAAYRRAVALSPGANPSRGNVGWLLILLGRPEEAEQHLRAVLAAAPPDHVLRPFWHFCLGLVNLHLGRGDHGAAEFRRAVCTACSGEPRGDTPPRILHLAAALAHGGQVAEARTLVAEELERRPELTLARLRTREDRSRHPAYFAQRERLLAGLALAGLPE